MKIELGDSYVLQDWDTAWSEGDQDRWISFADDYDVWANLSDNFPHPYTRADAEHWIALQSDRSPAVNIAICDNKGPIGGIGFNTLQGDLRHSAEIGYWLGKPFWGLGITTSAVKAVTTYGFDMLALVRIDAMVRPHNAPSVRVLEKSGYSFEGLLRRAALKDGVPIDLLLYAIVRDR